MTVWLRNHTFLWDCQENINLFRGSSWRSLGRAASRLRDARDRQVMFCRVLGWFLWPPFSSVIFCSLWVTMNVRWVSHQQPLSRRYPGALPRLGEMQTPQRGAGAHYGRHGVFYMHFILVSLPFWGLEPFSCALLLHSGQLAVWLMFSNYLLVIFCDLLCGSLVCK